MSGPGIDEIREALRNPGSEPLQTVFLHQVEAEFTETEGGLMIAETRPYKPAELNVSNAGPIAVTMLQAKVHHPSNNQAAEALVGEISRFLDRPHNVHITPTVIPLHSRP